MPSRKRLKGKDRKSKKGSSTKANGHSQQQTISNQAGITQLVTNLSLEASGNCVHNFPLLQKNDIVLRFMHEVESALQTALSYDAIAAPSWACQVFSQIIMVLHDKGLYQQILCGEEGEKQKLLSCLISLGTDYLLQRENAHVYSCAAGLCLLLTKHVEQGIAFVVAPSNLATMRDMCNDRERGTTKFFKKRLKCDCLKEKYEQVKSNPTLDACFNCRKAMERKKLMICSGCSLAMYCSQSCQRAHYPKHRYLCTSISTTQALSMQMAAECSIHE